MTRKPRNLGWLTALSFAALFAPQTIMAQDPAAKDNRPMLFGFMVDGRMVQARIVGGQVTATVTPNATSATTLTDRNNARGFFVTTNRHGQPFPKEQMKVSKGLVRFLDKDGNVAAELTYWNGGGNLTVAPRKVPVRLGITLAQTGTRHGGQPTIPVDEVAPDGPADKAGMKPGDQITEINGRKPATEEALRKALKEKKPGDTFKVKVLRDGEEQELTATLQAAPEKADAFGSDPLLGWHRQQLVRARKDIDMLTAQQSALQALLKKQTATIRKAQKYGAGINTKDDSKNEKEDAVEVFRKIQTELKKTSDKARERKKELDAKLQELTAEEARQNALVWMNRATQRGLTLVQRNNTPPAPALGKARKLNPLGAAPLQRLVFVDPTLTNKAEDNQLGQQVHDLEKRLARIEKLLEEGLSRQREADRKESRDRHLRNHQNEIDAKLRELKRVEGEESGKENDPTKSKR
jgi:PDZ domain